MKPQSNNHLQKCYIIKRGEGGTFTLYVMSKSEIDKANTKLFLYLLLKT